MATYLVGDIQGCYSPLRRALDRVQFEPARDELWAVGDLVNRGRENLLVVDFLRSLGTQFRSVLGNHDLHFLAVALGAKSKKRQDTLEDLLAARHLDEIVAWFRSHPLALWQRQTLLVHAGVPPNWDLEQTLSRASEVSDYLTGPNAVEFLSNMYGGTPRHFDESLTGWPRLRAITNALTRMRFCTEQGVLDLENKLGPESAAPGMRPWYSHAQRKLADVNIVFGHWAHLDGKADSPNVYALDTGCVWGRSLTLLRLEDKQRILCDC